MEVEFLRSFEKDLSKVKAPLRKKVLQLIRTMEAADTVYGVTMEENGISKLLSMKLK